MEDKDKIKFAIRYLKLGLKSKRTPPLYERLIQELGFEENDKVQELEEKLKEETAQRIYNFNKSIEWKEKHRELEAQIEKMKCCGNCENRYGQEKCADCHNYSKWKFKQAEQFYEEIVT